MATQPTAVARSADGRPFTRGDGGTVTGRWSSSAVVSNAFEVLADDGRVHTDVTSGVRREVVQRAERPRLALLSRDEALATHAGRIREALLQGLRTVTVEQLLGLRPQVLDELQQRAVRPGSTSPTAGTGSVTGCAASPSPAAPDGGHRLSRSTFPL